MSPKMSRPSFSFLYSSILFMADVSAASGAVHRQSSFPQRPSSAATARWRARDSRSFEVKALRHFQHRQLGDIPVRLVAKNFGQEKDVIEDLASDALLMCSDHPNPLSIHKKRRSIGSPMSAFAQRKLRCSRL